LLGMAEESRPPRPSAHQFCTFYNDSLNNHKVSAKFCKTVTQSNPHIKILSQFRRSYWSLARFMDEVGILP